MTYYFVLGLLVLLSLSPVQSFLAVKSNKWLSRGGKLAVNNKLTENVTKSKPKKVLDKNMFTTDGADSGICTADRLSFSIYGEPQVLERHRTLKTGMTYNPSAAKQQLFRTAALKYLPSVPLNGSLEVNLMFYFARPKNHFGSGRNSAVLKPDKSEIFQSSRKGMSSYRLFYSLINLGS